MIRYEVTLEIGAGQAGAVETYLRGKHIPEIFATGCFQRIEFARASDTRFRTSYVAATRDDLERYLREHTAHFRADFMAHFPGGVVAEREVWEEVDTRGA